MNPASQKTRIFDRPFVLFMGPQRSGTSWIDRYLRYRDDVCMPSEVKEIFFFDRHYGRGLEFYKSHFSPAKSHKIISEVTTTSFDHADAPGRIYDIFGHDIKLICPIRHPVPRSYSLYRHYHRYGLVTGSLQEACEAEPQIINSSRYAYHLQRWLEFYPKEQITFLFQEDMDTDQAAYVIRLCDVLGIPHREADKQLAGKFNAATASSSSFIASLAQAGADWLRARRMYFVVNAAKKMGAKQLIFGKERPDVVKKPMTQEELRYLEEQLASEVAEFETLVGPVKQWQSISMSGVSA